MLDRLVSRAVFTDTDRIVRENVDHGNFHDGTETDSRLAIIGKDEKGGGERAQFGERQAVGDSAHRVFANAEVHVAAAARVGLKIANTVKGEASFGGRIKVRGAAHQ